jgi:membrane-associated phospholipid phosphatase
MTTAQIEEKRKRIMDKLPKTTLISFVVCAFLYLLLFLFLDRPVDLWVHNNCSGTQIEALGTFISYWGYGSALEILLAVGFIVGVTGLVLDDGKEKYWISCLLYVCVSCAVAITIGDGLKILLARYRPIMLFESGKYGLHFFSTNWVLNSTPSGHTLRAFSLMTALSMVLPQGRILFIAVAVLIGISRIVVTAHYPSDVLFGAFIGIFCALWTYKLKKV